MTVPQFTGSNTELEELVDDVWTSGSPSGVLDLSQIFAWRDAAVARHLAEAGAVHPGVHTPNRVMQWLGEHGWQAVSPARPERLTAQWTHSDDGRVFVPLHPETVDYARYTGFVIENAAEVARMPMRQVLLEIASMPEELAW